MCYIYKREQFCQRLFQSATEITYPKPRSYFPLEPKYPLKVFGPRKRFLCLFKV
jgi:hypothetical protein